MIRRLLVALAAVLGLVTLALPSYALTPDDGGAVISDLDIGDDGETPAPDATVTPLNGHRFFYNRFCVENWTDVDEAYVSNSTRWWDTAADLDNLVFRNHTRYGSTCASFAGFPSYQIVVVDTIPSSQWQNFPTCGRLLTAPSSSQPPYWATYPGLNPPRAITIRYNRYRPGCRSSSTFIQRQYSAGVGYAVGCASFHGGATTTGTTPLSYSTMNVDRVVSGPTALDVGNADSCANRRY